MLYCDPCRKENNWPVAFTGFLGTCEVCKKHAVCWSGTAKKIHPHVLIHRAVEDAYQAVYLVRHALSRVAQQIEHVRNQEQTEADLVNAVDQLKNLRDALDSLEAHLKEPGHDASSAGDAQYHEAKEDGRVQ